MQYIYNFQQGKSEGNMTMRDTLGGKGANLAEMCNLNIPVPSGFTIVPSASNFFTKDSFNSSDKFNFNIQFEEAIKKLEKQTNTLFSSEENPCLVSVRSGAKFSMPGMMDSVLNLGLNSYLIDKLISKTGNPFFVYDSYRRFIQTYSCVVLGISSDLFEDRLECLDTPTVEELKTLCKDFKQIVKDAGKRIPSNAYEQLQETIKAVFNSWYSDRAKVYRKMNSIPEDIGTAVSIQTMVYGNKNNTSLTGVLFSRDCVTGENKITGEYLMNAQGEDIVSGYSTPDPISLYSSKDIAAKLGYSEGDRLSCLQSLEEINPSVYIEITTIAKRLEAHYKDVQDIEFTVEDGKLWVLQTRVAKKTKKANHLIQKSLFLEDIISYEELKDRTQHLELGEVKRFITNNVRSLSTGLAASPGLAVGQIVFNSEDAKLKKNEDIILVREQTDTHDLEGILAANGTLTAKGGTTSHAALVCREADLCCVVGAFIEIDSVTKTVHIGDKTFVEGDWLSIDGETGNIYAGRLEII